MSDSDVCGADAAVINEQREGRRPGTPEAVTAHRSVSTSPSKNRKASKRSNHHRKRSRHVEVQIVSSGDDSGESSGSSDSDSASSRDSSIDSASPDSDSSSSALSEERDDSDHPSTSRDGGYIRLEVQDESNKKRPLPEDMSAYLTKTFTSFIPDKLLRENILDKYPVPSTSAVQAPKLDNYVPEIFNTTKSSYGKSYDTNLHQIQSRIGAVMGPISKIWLDLHNIRMGRSTGEDLDSVDWLNVVEKSITLLGQAFSTTTYHRRMNILYNLTKDVKEAKNLLKTNSEDLSKGDNLFGKRFYKALSKASKIRKKSREISRQLGSSERKRNKQGQSKTKRPQGYSRPFQSGAPSRSARGGARFSFKPRGSASKSNRGKPTFSFSKPRSNKKSIITCQPGYSGKQGCIGVSKNGAKHIFASRSSKKLHLVPAEMDYPVGGRLRHFLGNWKLLTQDNFILQIVQGLEIPFLETLMQICPCPCPQPNQKNCILIDQEVQMMISKEAVKQVSACPDQFLSPVFLVQKKDGGQRPVINLKRLNQYVEYQHFKLEGIQALKSLVKKGDFMVKLDLSDAYFGVPILKSHRKYLRFVWRGKTFEFQALPFGLGVGPRYYTKLLKPVIAFLRRIGVRIIIYLDDMILLNQSSHMLLRDLTSLRWLLENLGFIINWKKSVWAPTQEIQYLGFLIDSVNMVIRLPSEKIQKIILKCQRLVSKKIIQVRKISEILGLMTSSLQAIAPAPLHYRHLQMTHIRGLLVNKSYQAKVALNSECLLELRWWISQMQSWNGKSMISAGPDLTLTSDASKRGWGATLGSERAQGLWTQEETSLHINVLELKGALFALRTFAQDLRKVHVHLKLDNRTAVAYIQKMGGTRSARMLPITQEIWKFALDREIVLSAEYLPGSLNSEADWQSRNYQDSSDWQLKKCLFQQLNNRWGSVHEYFPDITRHSVWCSHEFYQTK